MLIQTPQLANVPQHVGGDGLETALLATKATLAQTESDAREAALDAERSSS